VLLLKDLDLERVLMVPLQGMLWLVVLKQQVAPVDEVQGPLQPAAGMLPVTALRLLLVAHPRPVASRCGCLLKLL
jgi:hypothetical protein